MMEKSTLGTGEGGLIFIECGPESICMESDSKCGKAVVRKGEPSGVESKREKRGSNGREGVVIGDVGRVKEWYLGITLNGIAEDDDAVR